MRILTEALATAEDLVLEQSNLGALAPATGAWLFASANGVRHSQLGDYNPVQQILEAKEARRVMSRVTARTYLQLLKERHIPSWAVAQVDVKFVRMAAG